MRAQRFIIFIVILGLLVVGGWFALRDRNSDNFNISPSEVFDTEIIDTYSTLTVITIDGIEINVDVAETPKEKAEGLSGQANLTKEQGMLFVYEKPDLYSVWMKDMNFPIDIIWIDENFQVIDITENFKPESFPRAVKPQKPVQYVVEVNAGWVKKHRVHIGSPVIFNTSSAKTFVEEDVEDTLVFYEETISMANVFFDVPFTPQAVFGNWADVRQSNACEEASVLMAMRWVEGKNLLLKDAEEEIIAISDFEKEKYGHFHDTSARDTVERIFKDYFKYEGVSVRYNIGMDDIKK